MQQKKTQQVMVVNMQGKIQHDDEVLYIFIPIKQTYNNNLKKHFAFEKFWKGGENMGKQN
jgi:hypothetical protein